MTLENNVEKIQGRGASNNAITDGQEDISGGVTADITTDKGDAESVTLYLETGGAVDVTVEFSPDGENTWYEPQGESPISFGGANEEIVHINYNATHVKLTGSDATGVEAKHRVVA